MMEMFSPITSQSPLNSRSLVDFKQAGIRRAREPSRESCQQIILPPGLNGSAFTSELAAFTSKLKLPILIYIGYSYSLSMASLNKFINREIMRLAN